jgi:hypothetical protein
MTSATAETNLLAEFDRQIANLAQKGYPPVRAVDVLRSRVEQIISGKPAEGARPFVVVVRSTAMPVEKSMPLVELNGNPGFLSLTPRTPADFRPIERLGIPAGDAYLLIAIDRGRETLNLPPEQALPMITARGRSPLTIEEGIAILTHYPEFLRKNHCFSLLGSRDTDRRVPALWISEGRPRLGWCWDGAPHAWLGSASCGSRVGC